MTRVSSSSEDISDPETFDLTLLTQNLWGVPFASFKRKERFQEFTQDSDALNADVYLLQETFPEKLTRKWITEPWQKARGFFSRGGKGNVHQPLSSGLTTLSRAEILKRKFIPFHAKSGIDALARKGILLTRLRLESGQEIDIYNVHLNAGGKAKNELARSKQVAEIEKTISELSGEDHTVIVAGDFNFDETDPEYKNFTESNGSANDLDFLDLGRTLFTDPQANPLNTYGGWESPRTRRLDYVFVRPGTGYRLESTNSDFDIVSLDISDHDGILAKLTFIPDGETSVTKL